ncbi:hypothetical protein [Desertibaculum subflavum]|uniref:hypothetical protein n=1 Tax=Desertibaculum subflavum TaxID=2268458 RepID=UPI0013C4571C
MRSAIHNQLLAKQNFFWEMLLPTMGHSWTIREAATAHTSALSSLRSGIAGFSGFDDTSPPQGDCGRLHCKRIQQETFQREHCADRSLIALIHQHRGDLVDALGYFPRCRSQLMDDLCKRWAPL